MAWVLASIFGVLLITLPALRLTAIEDQRRTVRDQRAIANQALVITDRLLETTRPPARAARSALAPTERLARAASPLVADDLVRDADRAAEEVLRIGPRTARLDRTTRTLLELLRQSLAVQRELLRRVEAIDDRFGGAPPVVGGPASGG